MVSTGTRCQLTRTPVGTPLVSRSTLRRNGWPDAGGVTTPPLSPPLSCGDSTKPVPELPQPANTNMANNTNTLRIETTILPVLLLN